MYLPITNSNEWETYSWLPMLNSAGGRLLTEDGKKAAFNSPAGVRALTMLQQMQQNGVAGGMRVLGPGMIVGEVMPRDVLDVLTGKGREPLRD